MTSCSTKEAGSPPWPVSGCPLTCVDVRSTPGHFPRTGEVNLVSPALPTSLQSPFDTDYADVLFGQSRLPGRADMSASWEGDSGVVIAQGMKGVVIAQGMKRRTSSQLRAWLRRPRWSSGDTWSPGPILERAVIAVPPFEWVVEDLSKNHAVTAPTSMPGPSPRRTPLCWTQLGIAG